MRSLPLLQASSLTELTVLMDELFEDSTPLATVIDETNTMITFAFDDDSNGDFTMKVCEALIPRIAKRGAGMNEQALRVREVLADHYEVRGRVNDVRNVLSTIPVAPGLRSARADFQLSVALRLIRLALQHDDVILFDSQLPRALAARKALSSSDPATPSLHHEFLGLQAQVFDRKRKFFDAGLRFYECSTKSEDEAERLEFLRRSIVCGILCNAGPQRSKLLATLVKDERVAQFGDLSAIVTTVHASRFIRPEDISVLTGFLEPHHTKEINAAGQSALQAAVAQHNLQAASRFYSNLSLTDLGELLGIQGHSVDAEKIAAQMIAEGRLAGSIDQVDQYIYFAHNNDVTLREWDAHILETCNVATSIATDISVRYGTSIL
ncbi:COP9 signalosome complex subunit 4-like, putative [Bodo saltans]|uniref:COP9 signalosome complex subunit 4 n=1 Tax=Bodo saltans TaxID=75058 RepID=A0A0S4IUW4_BODSA|nr:COP9 signalosome complex subunit 4-like, putative [Bodo saltans]|eukprot:CUF96244.1 COP9 signalosome complex subunit 4-like, putative [Bodo saltans]